MLQGATGPQPLVDFRNDRRVFGIKEQDRFSHIYVIGKTGTGKSTLLETMALQDLERGNGFALIDPHGDLVARVAARIPTSHRKGDLPMGNARRPVEISDHETCAGALIQAPRAVRRGKDWWSVHTPALVAINEE
jgi:ABC-type polar amino acid transport system ATPase subunit